MSLIAQCGEMNEGNCSRKELDMVILVFWGKHCIEIVLSNHLNIIIPLIIIPTT